jgi:DNA (cytosine-5)-methyltransferase 1
MENSSNLGVYVRECIKPEQNASSFSRRLVVRAAEIFAGAGGLTIATAQAGFKHAALIELDDFACETIRANQGPQGSLAKDWPLFQKDIRAFDYASIDGEIDLMCAGLPCQPFSLGGKGMAHQDPRDMFGEVVRAVRSLQPRAILIENVKGLLRPALKDYFEYLLLALASPNLVRRVSQSWREHLLMLQRRRPQDDLKYDINVEVVNAADYGVPQWRERVLIVAFRSDLKIEWSAPEATHSLDALLWQQWKTGEYWERHRLSRSRRGLMSRRIASRDTNVRKLELLENKAQPWKTVRDAIADLPRAVDSKKAASMQNHFLIPGARAYSGHSGSLLDEPAKTLKAGDHGVPGGENTLSLGGGKVRYFTVRECARLQTFPDAYAIKGAWTRAMRQIGNAVPVALGLAFTTQIRNHLQEAACTR